MLLFSSTGRPVPAEQVRRALGRVGGRRRSLTCTAAGARGYEPRARGGLSTAFQPCCLPLETSRTWPLAAITGTLALVPFLGYAAVAVAALTLQLAGASTAASAVVFMAAACVVFGGDKVLRPAIARDGTGLSFVWVLMACLGGFEVLGLVGLIVGPVLRTLTRELWSSSYGLLNGAGSIIDDRRDRKSR